MKIIILTFVLILTSLSSFAAQADSTDQASFVFKPHDSSQSFVAEYVNETKQANSCLASCRFQLRVCNFYNPLLRCEREHEQCIEACFD